MITNKLKLFVLVTTLVMPLLLPNSSLAALPVSPDFNPNNLISDKDFKNTRSMNGASAIQKFLEEKKSVLANTSNSFKVLLKEPVGNTALKTILEDPTINNSTPRSAAELIWDASVHSGINPQVILVKLHKEQSLIGGHQNSTPEQLQRALDFAMGFGCPDSGPCGELYRGFYFQLFGNVDAENNRYLGATKSLMRSVETPGGRGPYYNGKISQVGDVIVLSNTLGGYEGVQPQQTVTLANAATAALYRYTPHVFNGNYNFWRYWNEWFGSGRTAVDTGPRVFDNGSIVEYNREFFMIEDGKRLTISDFVMKARNINPKFSSAGTLTRREASAYPVAGRLGLMDNTVVKTEQGYYVFVGNKIYSATEASLKQRGLSSITALTAKQSDIADFEDGGLLPPQEGAVLRGVNNPAVYVVENAQLRLVSALVFAQRNLAGKLQIIPDAELDKYPKGGFIPPLDGTMVKSPSDPTVSLIADRIKRPIPSVLVFKTYGKTFADIKTISDDELTAIPTGALAEPKDNTYYRVSDNNQLYVYRNGSRHFISAFVAKQRLITPDVTFSAAEVASWPEGEPILPKDGTLIKASNRPTVYIVEGGQLKALSGESFKSRGFSFSSVNALPPEEINKYLSVQGS